MREELKIGSTFTCLNCDKEFITRIENQYFCSSKCVTEDVKKELEQE